MQINYTCGFGLIMWQYDLLFDRILAASDPWDVKTWVTEAYLAWGLAW